MDIYEVTNRSTKKTHYVEATSTRDACALMGWLLEECHVRRADRQKGQEDAPENRVWFTQFLMPNGRERRDCIERPTGIALKARAVEKHGGRFEMELLSDYATVSLACAWKEDGEWGDQVSALCHNGPGLEEVVDSIVEQAYSRLVAAKEE